MDEIEAPGTAEHPSVDEQSATAATTAPGWAKLLLVVALLILGTQALVTFSIRQQSALLSEELATLRSESQIGLDAVDARVDRLNSLVGALGLQVEQLGTGAPVGGVSQVDGAASSQSGLPPIPQGGADPALGVTLGAFTAIEWATDAEYTVEASGKAKVIMIWAHWCPYCQQELPILQELTESGELAQFDAVELISVTTFMDESRPNPLIPYLEQNQFGFPVLLDPDNSLAGYLGVQAVPAWVIVDGEGTLLGRFTGAIPKEQVLGVFGEVQQIQAGS